MTGGGPLFAFAFRRGARQALSDLAETDAAVGNADFVWAHLDLDDAAAQVWLRSRPWPDDVIEMIAAPIQRGKLFITSSLVYGHLRDFRDAADGTTLQAGSLCIVASQILVVTGRRIPLRSIDELRRRVEAGMVAPTNSFGLITEFFRALNDIGEALLQKASERLSEMESNVLKRKGDEQRHVIQEVRRRSIEIARDMAYKRTALLDLMRERPALIPDDEFVRLTHQIHRYAALVEDAQEYAERCQFTLQELRAQVEEETNRNLYILTMLSAIFLPSTLIASIWGMNVGGIPFADNPIGFWVVDGLIVAAFVFITIFLIRLKLL